MTTRKLKLFICENYLPDYLRVIEKEKPEKVSVEAYPSLCFKRWAYDQVKAQLQQTVENDDDGVIFCSRFCDILKLVPESPNIKVVSSNYCFSHLATPPMIQAVFDEGGYIIGLGWLNSWKETLKELGFDRKMAQEFYKEVCAKLVYIDTGIDPSAKGKLEELSEYLKIPALTIPYDLESLELSINGVIAEWKMAQQPSKNTVETPETQNQLQAQAAEYATIMDVLGRIGSYDSREMAMAGIQEIFTAVMGANDFRFISKEEDLSGIPAEAAILFDDPSGAGMPPPKFYLEEEKHRFFVAVKYVNQVHGIIEAGNFLFPQYISRYLNFALSVSPICGLVLTNIERYETIVKISQLDPLTSAYNRRYLMGKLQEEADRAARTKRPFSLVMLDIDHFKQINDRFGHQWGDTALKALVGMIKKRIRKIDTLGRWGGEEFLILLPETSGSHAVLLAEELRTTLFQTEIQEVGHMTASFGVAEYREGDSVDSLVNRTDDQMYRAKQTGRNRVCCEMIE